jgi:DNA repair exonuclease SbcCD ATPase subunit
MWASHWFLTIFTSKFPLHLVFYILDLFLYNKFNTIFQVSIALLSISQAELLKLDFEGVLKYFRVHLPKKYSTDANAKFLLKTAFNVKVKKLDKYEKDYAQFKEARQDPVQRLTNENQRLQTSVLRLEQENDLLAQEIGMSKLTMRKTIDILEDKLDQFANERNRQNKYLNELEEEKKLLLVQVSKLQELCRRELDNVETKANQKEKISNQYKEICSKLSKRLEEQEKLNKELKDKMNNCSKCSQFIEDNNKDDDLSSGSASILEGLRKNSSEEHDEIKQLEARIHDLEIELAGTKLELVEAKCDNQALIHKLNLNKN